MQDSQGTLRGGCTQCVCACYRPQPGAVICFCSHRPIQHHAYDGAHLTPHPLQLLPLQGYAYPPLPLCSLHGCSKQVAIEGQRVHDYCCRAHAETGAKSTSTQWHVSTSGSTGVCQYPGCPLPCFVERGRVHDYCGLTHAQAAQAIIPRMRSLSIAALSGPSIRIIASTDPKFNDIKKQFLVAWRHPNKPKGQILSICEISSPTVDSQYETYRDGVIKNPLPLKIFGHGGPGNAHRRFHGTPAVNWKCTLGLNDNSALCSDTTCSICMIIKTGLMMSKCQSNITFARFGRGLYLSSASSKAHDYATPDSARPKIRVMFLCDVVVGRGKKYTLTTAQEVAEAQQLIKAPDGHDSVLGEPATGGQLNYDEVVVYTPHAVRPHYLIIYQEGA